MRRRSCDTSRLLCPNRVLLWACHPELAHFFRGDFLPGAEVIVLKFPLAGANLQRV